MQTTKTIFPRPQEQGSSIEMPVRTASPGRRFGWHQRLCRWWANRWHKCPRGVDDLWKAQHEQVQPPPVEDYLIFSHRTSLSVTIVLYTSLS